jgi:hypothetical protein
MTEIVPFVATEEEHRTVDTLPTEGTSVTDLMDAIPKFKDVVRGNLLVQWALLPNAKKETVLTYHIYKVDRKKIFDLAEATLLETTNPTTRATIASEANAALEERPWWPEFGETLKSVLEDHFKYVAGKLGYYREVDSWSASIDATDQMWPDSYIESFANKLALKVGG